MTDQQALSLFNRATDAINKRWEICGVPCGCQACTVVYRRWSERHDEVERRGLKWRAP